MRGRKAAEINGIADYDFNKLSKTEGKARKQLRYLALLILKKENSSQMLPK